MELIGILNYALFIGILAGIYALLSLGLNMQWGLAGLFNIGIVGFFAIGAYSFGIISGKVSNYHIGGWEMPMVLGAIGAMLIAAFFAWIIGKLCLRLRSDYLAIATIGLAETIRLVLKSETWLSGGPRGITGIPRPFSDLAYTESQMAFFALVVGLVFLTYLLLQRQLKAPWGRMMRAIRDNEISARSIGKEIEKKRLHAFILGCVLMALGGVLFAMFNRSITPEAMDPIHMTFLIWVMLILGGSGNNKGAILGALIVTTVWSVSEIITDQLPHEIAVQAKYARVFLVGLVLQLILRFRPEGLLPEFRLQANSK
jgi:branched-chain amino acid transport system permease protein